MGGPGALSIHPLVHKPGSEGGSGVTRGNNSGGTTTRVMYCEELVKTICNSMDLISTRTKWPPFRRQYFQMHFRE